MLSLQLIALSACSAAARVPADDVSFQARDGLELTRTLEVTTTLTTDESVLAFGDQEHVAGEGMVLSREYSAQVHDTYGTPIDGRPARLVRRFDRVRETNDLETGDAGDGVMIEGPGDETSALEGRTVAFDWDADAGGYSKEFADEEPGEEDWLEGLAQDLDLRALLPEGGVEQGDRWELEPAVVGQLLRPGGRMLVQESVPEHDLPDGGIAITMPDPNSIELWEGLEGDVAVRYTGTREVDGRRLGVLAVELEVESVQDVADELNRQQRAQGMPEVPYDMAEMERELTGKGELLWDLERGVLAAFELEVELAMVFEAEWLADAGGMEMNLALHQAHSGEVRVSLGAE